MELELEPIDGKKSLTKEERERLKRRSRTIPPEALHQFSHDEQDEIKKFLVRLIVLCEECHHYIEKHDTSTEDQQQYYKNQITNLNKDRTALFQNPSPFLDNFIKLLDLCPMEPWQEFEALIRTLQAEELHHYRDTKLSSGIKAASDNPFLIQAEDDLDEQHIELEMKSRITPKEIETLITHYSLEDLVKYLINTRRVYTGEFWNEDYYDL